MRPRQSIRHLDADQLKAHPGNIRDDLGDLTDMARSIREHGILQPITVTENGDGRYVILAGHRRFGAGLKVGLQQFPAIIRHGLDDPAEQLVVMLVENTQRRDLDPIERANAYGALVNQGLSQSDIARRVGCSPSTVNYYLSFLELDAATIAEVRLGRVTAGDARDAVVTARQDQRKSAGMPVRGRPKVPTYFGPRHRLSNVVVEACDHADRPAVGSSGCGPCWEQAIVDDWLAQQARDVAS